MILVWNVLIGATYSTIIKGGSALAIANGNIRELSFHSVLYVLLGLYSIIGALQLVCYPLGGLIADICYGRYRIISLSVVKSCCGYAVLLVPVIMTLENQAAYKEHKEVFYLFVGIVVIFILLGFTGFQANAVQFGLDQLLDSSSEELSMFLHWYVWTNTFGETIMEILVLAAPCSSKKARTIFTFLIIPLIVFSVAILFLSYCKRHWFHREPCTRNPYGTVYRVLRFVARHDKPLRRSAFSFCDDERPSRMDFAKQRFGGPFTTETVEDVKTFLRILLMLLAIGPTYAVKVAVDFLFPFFGLHVGPVHSLPVEGGKCKYLEWVILETGSLGNIVTVVTLPIYITFFLPHLRKYYPKILFRLGMGIFLLFLTTVAMTATQMVGHHYQQDNNASCLFSTNYSAFSNFPTLNLPSWVLVFPNLLNGFALPIIYISILEFVSAQSPHTMKGLLLGVFYAVRGFFIIMGCTLVLPFAKGLWDKHEGKLFNCGVSFYVSVSLLGVVGLVVFGVAVRFYRYRQREDQPYDPRYVEDYYQRYIKTRRDLKDGSEEGVLSNNSILDYGTMVGT